MRNTRYYKLHLLNNTSIINKTDNTGINDNKNRSIRHMLSLSNMCYVKCNAVRHLTPIINNAMRAEITQTYLTTADLCFLPDNIFMPLILWEHLKTPYTAYSSRIVKNTVLFKKYCWLRHFWSNWCDALVYCILGSWIVCCLHLKLQHRSLEK